MPSPQTLDKSFPLCSKVLAIRKRECDDMHTNNSHATNPDAADVDRQRKVIRLWNELRQLKKAGQPTAAVVRRIEAALAERENCAA
ncbi:hypothetical protein JQ633_20110 [Bradyrhizobium tropiciagri]|uniref:hypothetical protein n=1 Tax=Bradyrhizobium tropiciagri TaxID=312253 RepID=UPI001BAA98B8|nr:hypothetical protein [Bradyrhizobium tropiciagri]MBR0872677.1 hypothetical protein [Bradyrhizobium tropiciagri]